MDSMRDTSTSLSPKNPSFLLVVVVTRAKGYIKGEESNAEKNVCGVKEYVPNAGGSHHQRKSSYTSPIKDKIAFNRVGKLR